VTNIQYLLSWTYETSKEGNASMKRWGLLILIACFLAACKAPTPSADSIATAIEATARMKQTLETSTPTETATEIATATLTATASPEPSPTLPLHPINIYEDFSSHQVSWLGCDVCEFKNNALYMGPYPTSNASQANFAICEECGEVTYYHMSVVATYVDGPTDRGYGFVLRLTDDYFTVLEIYSWQIVGLIKVDRHGEVEVLDARFSGAINASGANNHIEVYVTESQQGRTDISVSINGKVVFIVWGEPKDQSPVGLYVYGHALEVSFDNFEFEEYRPYGDPIELDDLPRPSGG
jgi:hypothetical protein